MHAWRINSIGNESVLRELKDGRMNGKLCKYETTKHGYRKKKSFTVTHRPRKAPPACTYVAFREGTQAMARQRVKPRARNENSP
jgi:hypothetical protein